MMGGIVGRLFREFAVTLSSAILVSMVISLTTTPMMCAYLLKDQHKQKHGRIYTAFERAFDWVLWLLPAQPRTGVWTIPPSLWSCS